MRFLPTAFSQRTDLAHVMVLGQRDLVDRLAEYVSITLGASAYDASPAHELRVSCLPLANFAVIFCLKDL